MSQNKRKFSDNNFLIILGLIIVVIIGFLAYRGLVIHNNKQGFVQARAAIDDVYAEIVNKVGQPDNSKSVNDCSQVHEEFDNGPITCFVGTDFIYSVTDPSQATQKFQQIQSIISEHSDQFQPIQTLSTGIKDTYVVNDVYHSAQDYYRSANNLDCTIKYTFDTPKETFLSLSPTDQDKKSFYISMACSDFAKGLYYPLENPR